MKDTNSDVKQVIDRCVNDYLSSKFGIVDKDEKWVIKHKVELNKGESYDKIGKRYIDNEDKRLRETIESFKG